MQTQQRRRGHYAHARPVGRRRASRAATLASPTLCWSIPRSALRARGSPHDSRPLKMRRMVPSLPFLGFTFTNESFEHKSSFASAPRRLPRRTAIMTAHRRRNQTQPPAQLAGARPLRVPPSSARTLQTSWKTRAELRARRISGRFCAASGSPRGSRKRPSPNAPG